MANKFCVIIPVFNDWYRIENNIALFLDMKARYRDDLDVVFVDNGSDSIPAVSEEFEVDICTKPGSYSARNFALKKRLDRYDYFIFTDADCKPSDQWISDIYREVEQSKQDLLAGAVIMYSESSRHTLVESYDLILGIPQARYVRNGYAVTANLTVARTVFSTVGVFDDTRFSGGDAEFCRRAVQAGFNLNYCERAAVYHPARKSWSEIVNKVRRVTGGQTGNGPRHSRIKYLVANIIPPARAFLFILNTDASVTFGDKVRAALVVGLLWPVRLIESVKAFMFGPSVR